MSSYTRQSFLLYRVQCQVTLDSPSVPGPMLNYTRQPFMLYQIHCRVTLDSPFVPGPMSSHTRQPFLLYRVQCRVTLDSPIFSTRSNVELKSTCYLVYHVLRSSKLLRSNGCFWNPNINRFSGRNWTRLSELTVTIWTAKWRSCWPSQNLDAERGNEECSILSHKNQFKYPRTQCR